MAKDDVPDIEPSTSSGTGSPRSQKLIGILIIVAIIALVLYLTWKSGALQKVPMIGKLLPKR